MPFKVKVYFRQFFFYFGQWKECWMLKMNTWNMPEKNRHTLDLNILQVWFSHWSLWIQKCPHLPLNVAHVGLWSTRHWTTGIWACSGYVSRFLQKPAVWPASFGRACWENQQPTNSQYGWEHWPEFSGGSVRTQPLSSGDRWTNSRLLVKGAVRVFFC